MRDAALVAAGAVTVDGCVHHGRLGQDGHQARVHHPCRVALQAPLPEHGVQGSRVGGIGGRQRLAPRCVEVEEREDEEGDGDESGSWTTSHGGRRGVPRPRVGVDLCAQEEEVVEGSWGVAATC